jgi:uncharacterized protein
MRDFRFSFIFSFICLSLAAYWGYTTGGGINGVLVALTITAILGIMEISLSFDNAVVNASVLKDMDEYWQKMFLTVGILVAVFGMRLVFPILIVAVASGQGLVDVMTMALKQPDLYSQHLMSSHTSIAAFGGIFLYMVFLGFLLDDGKEIHWLGVIEEKLGRLGKIDSIQVVIGLITLLLLQHYLPISAEQKATVLMSGVCGLVLYVVVDSLGSLFEDEDAGDAAVSMAKRSGAMAFVYLEILDASFSFDGVIAAFAITKDVVIIMLGLAIGAIFVRSMTIYLVKKGTLQEYIYLEHGAHYAIGILAIIMFVSIHQHVPELFTGLVGVGFIVAAVISSVIYKRKQAKEAS